MTGDHGGTGERENLGQQEKGRPWGNRRKGELGGTGERENLGEQENDWEDPDFIFDDNFLPVSL
jgi:hypothetical protein